MYIPKSQSLTVGVVDDITLMDSRRDRKLPVRIYYPQEQGSFPVIIFSHGAGGSKEAFSSLSSFWCSCGYICIHPTHLGNDFSPLRETNLQELKNYVNDPKTWSIRPKDISFLIDSFDELKRQVPPLSERMDETRVGISGHSFGAYVTLLLAGAIVEIPGEQSSSFADNRASAFLAMSPQGTGQYGLNKQSWSQIKAPVLTVSGSKDQGWNRQHPSWRLEAFSYMPPGEKYHTLIVGANHFSYGDQKVINRTFQRLLRPKSNLLNIDISRNFVMEERIRSYVRDATITFWDAYLKQENSAKEFLKSEEFQAYSHGEVSVFMK